MSCFFQKNDFFRDDYLIVCLETSIDTYLQKNLKIYIFFNLG